ncbi:MULTISPECIES: hypothetical protein [unclassified Burkholderia]|uniref:hypothetical protein n=1 Tax=unclassified Burkholderia TaxID=2613784 RepID=UPI00162678A9|nr:MULTISPECIES: hypothetical protein [unclassified Burkholderia]
MAQLIEQRRIKEKFIAPRSYRRPWTGAVPGLHPAFHERHADYAGQPVRNGHE